MIRDSFGRALGALVRCALAVGLLLNLSATAAWATADGHCSSHQGAASADRHGVPAHPASRHRHPASSPAGCDHCPPGQCRSHGDCAGQGSGEVASLTNGPATGTGMVPAVYPETSLSSVTLPPPTEPPRPHP